MKVGTSGKVYKKNAKGAFRALKKVTAGLLTASIIALPGCGMQNTKSDQISQGTEPAVVETPGIRIGSDDTAIPDMTYDGTDEDIPVDISEKYAYRYIGDTSGSISIGESEFIKYKDTDNAFTREVSAYEDTRISISEENYREYIEYLNTKTMDIPYSYLFNLEHLNTLSGSNQSASHSSVFTLTNGLVNADSLYQQVLKNNSNVKLTGYGLYEIEDTSLKSICEIVADSVNYELRSNPYIDRDALLCNLSKLTIFYENDITNARITDALALLISPDNIEALQKEIPSLDAYQLTIMHEGKHLFQLNCEHEKGNTTGNIIGFNQKWSDEPINSLFWKWYYEASAEMLAAGQNGIDNVVYEHPTNYLKYLKFSMLLDENFDSKALEQVSVSRSREDFYQIFGAETEEEKLGIAEIMYAIELIQNENSDFEQIYLSDTGSEQTILSRDDWANLKQELKVGIGNNLAIMFYKNLAAYIKSHDLSRSDLYYLLTIYEAEVESHLVYDSLDRFGKNMSFMSSYIEMQQELFRMISSEQDDSYEDLVTGFQLYSLKQPSDLSFLSEDKKLFLLNREADLIVSVTTNILTFYDILSAQYEKVKELDLK